MATRTFKLYTPDFASADRPDAFAAVEKLRYPTPQWWAKVNPPRRPGRSDAPPAPPSKAAYWRDRSPQRLTNPAPLPGESKAGGKTRARKAKSYLATLAAFTRRRTRGNRAGGLAEWRIVMRGVVATRGENGGPFDTLGAGRQASPWQRTPRGTQVSRDYIRAEYLRTCRRAVTLGDHKGAPKWDESLGTFDKRIGYISSPDGVIFPEDETKRASESGTWLEFRIVD